MRLQHALAAVCAVVVLAACQDDTVSPSEQAPPVPGDRALDRRQGPLREGWIVGRDGRPLRVVFEDLDGRAIYEGDIDLGPTDSIATRREQLERPNGPRYGVVISGTQYRWSGGNVPYVIDPALPNPQRVLDAIAHVEATTRGVDFFPRPNVSFLNYVYFTTDTVACFSPVGKMGGQQNIRLASNCGFGAVVHEIGHTLGMHHEHNRCDRDTYVTVDTFQVLPRWRYAFTKVCSGYTDVLGYDEGSIMHYGRFDFSDTGQPVLTSKRGLNHLMGQRSGLSATDIHTVRGMYVPRGPAVNAVGNSGGSPLVTWTAMTADSYDVYLMVRYSENDLERGSSSYETVTYVGSTTGTSITDTGRSYTGTTWCQLIDTMYTTARDDYYYLIYAHGPNWNSVYSAVDAPVANCSA